MYFVLAERPWASRAGTGPEPGPGAGPHKMWSRSCFIVLLHSASILGGKQEKALLCQGQLPPTLVAQPPVCAASPSHLEAMMLGEGPQVLLPDRSLQQRLSPSRMTFLSIQNNRVHHGVPSPALYGEGTRPVAEQASLSEDTSVPVPVPFRAARPGAEPLLPRAQEVGFALECFKSLILISFWI